MVTTEHEALAALRVVANNSCRRVGSLLEGACAGVRHPQCYVCQARAAIPSLEALVADHEAKNTLTALQNAVERYLDKPGCNSGSRATAMAKLRHNLERSRT